MAEVDFRILAGLQPVQTPPVASTILQLAQLRQMRRAERAQQAAIAQAEAEAAQVQQEMLHQQRIRNALAEAAQVRTPLTRQQAPAIAQAAAPAMGEGPPPAIPLTAQQSPGGMTGLPGGTIAPEMLRENRGGTALTPPPTPGPPPSAVMAAAQAPPDAETFFAQPGAMRRLMGLDPTVASNLIKAARDDLALKQESLAFVGRGLSGVDTDDEYQAVLPELRQTLRQGGINPNILPGAFDKEAIANVRARGTTLDQALKMTDQDLRLRGQQIKQREQAAKLPARLSGLTGEVKNRLAAQGKLTPGNLAEPADIQAAIEDNERAKLAVAGERSRQEFLNRPVSSTVVTPLQNTDQLLYLLGEVQRRFRPEYVGFFTGPGRRLKAKTGQLSENEVAWRHAMDLASELWSRARSGAAINAGEMRRFNRQVPTEGDSAKVYRGKMQGMESFLRQHRRNLVGLGTMTVGEARRSQAMGTTVDPEIVAPRPAAPTEGVTIRSFKRIK